MKMLSQVATNQLTDELLELLEWLFANKNRTGDRMLQCYISACSPWLDTFVVDFEVVVEVDVEVVIVMAE